MVCKQPYLNIFPYSQEQLIQPHSTNSQARLRKMHRLPKIVINKKNFVFKEAIEQIRKDRRLERSNSVRRQTKDTRHRQVLSEEARAPNDQLANDMINACQVNPFIIANKSQAKKKIKLYAKNIKKRVSDPIPLDLEEPSEHHRLKNFTKFNTRCLSDLK